jgi:hypothetical protein
MIFRQFPATGCMGGFFQVPFTISGAGSQGFKPRPDNLRLA